MKVNGTVKENAPLTKYGNCLCWSGGCSGATTKRKSHSRLSDLLAVEHICNSHQQLLMSFASSLELACGSPEGNSCASAAMAMGNCASAERGLLERHPQIPGAVQW